MKEKTQNESVFTVKDIEVFNITVTKTDKVIKKIKHSEPLITECFGYKVVIKKKEKDI